MDHKAWLSRVAPEDRLRLTAAADRAGLLHMAGHLGLIGVLGAGVMAGVPGWPVLLPVLGVALVFLFTLEHECTHGTPFARAWLNRVVGHGCGVVLVLPFVWFRWFHMAHHRHTNIAGQDPELDGEKPGSRLAWAWHVTGIPYWLAMGRVVVRLALGREAPVWLPPGVRGPARREARVMLAIYAGLALTLLWSTAVVWLWLIPVALGQPALRVYLLAERGDCPRVADMFANTRTTLTTRLVRFLAWNMPFHAEHHVWPQVPFHQLPALHAMMRAQLQVSAPGYAAFTRAYLARRPNRSI